MVSIVNTINSKSKSIIFSIKKQTSNLSAGRAVVVKYVSVSAVRGSP